MLRHQLTSYFLLKSDLMALGYLELLFSVNLNRIYFHRSCRKNISNMNLI
jgi:hypothetical protein